MKFLKKLVGNSKDYAKMANAVGNVKAILDNIEQSYTADKEVFLIAAWICRVGIIDIIEKNNWTMNYKLLVRINGCNVSITFHEAYLMTIGRLSIKAEEQNNEIKECVLSVLGKRDWFYQIDTIIPDEQRKLFQ